MSLNNSLRAQMFFYIKDNPGSCRTEVRDNLKLQNNISGPAIKELIDRGMVMEGPEKMSLTTGKLGKTLYVESDWSEQLDSQYRIFE